MEEENNIQWTMFMAHIPKKEIDYVEETLKSYDIGGYLIGMESDPYEHMHFAVEMTEKDYHKFSKRVFKDKFKLRGRASKGNCRQYGKTKDVKDIDRMLAYTAKDKNIRTNLEDKQIKEILERSFKKVEELAFMDEVVNELEEGYPRAYMDIHNVDEDGVCFERYVARITIIEIFRKKGIKSISKNKVENVLYRFMMKQPETFVSTKDIYSILYPVG